MQMPELPDNQRWVVTDDWMGFVTVRLQEKRKHFGWKTVDSALCYKSEGTYGVRSCVDVILNRDLIDEIEAKKAAERAADYAQIPFGKSK